MLNLSFFLNITAEALWWQESKLLIISQRILTPKFYSVLLKGLVAPLKR